MAKGDGDEEDGGSLTMSRGTSSHSSLDWEYLWKRRLTWGHRHGLRTKNMLVGIY